MFIGLYRVDYIMSSGLARDGLGGAHNRISELLYSPVHLLLYTVWWSLCTVHLLAYRVRVTIGDSGFRCCVPCLPIAINSLCLLIILIDSLTHDLEYTIALNNGMNESFGCMSKHFRPTCLARKFE